MQQPASMRVRSAGPRGSALRTVAGRQATVLPRAQAQARVTTTPVDKDVTARLLQSALHVGLSNRLTEHKTINVDVRCTAGGLMNGVFGGMAVSGTGWRTPLELTASSVMVDVGELLLDYGALVNKSALALRNLPTGSCTFRLTASDLANFINHRLLQPVAAKAVQGKAFVWDIESVKIGVDAASGLGCVDWTGRWEGDGATYAVHMVPQPPSRPGAPSPLKVGAKRLSAPTITPAPAPAPAAPGSAPVSGTAAVAQGLANMFTQLTLNLEGIELRSPNLTLLLPDQEPSVSEPMLEISMKMKIRGIPPLNMQF